MGWSDRWFETMSRTLAAPRSRRSMLAGIAVGSVAAMVPVSADATDPANPGRCKKEGTTACCVDLESDPANCGACGNACLAGQICNNGTCGCPAGLVLCGTQCLNALSDNQNCGGCGHACPPGTVCLQGTSVVSCPVGETNCGGQCSNTLSDPLNCGSCGHVCSAGFKCSNGACVLS